MAQKRTKVVRQDILSDQLQLPYGDGTQGVLEYGRVAPRSETPISVQSEGFVELMLKQAKMELGTKN